MTLAAPTFAPTPNGVVVLTASETLTDVVDAGVNTTILDARGLSGLTFHLFNGGNQTTVFQLKQSSSSAFTTDQNVGESISLAATTGEEVAVLTDPAMYLRWNVNPSGASTGDITIEVTGRK